jgi:hypothetical protein
VFVLEGATGPLSVYDIQRGIQNQFNRTSPTPSLNVSVANDLRCCWAGRGLYALYRHGFIPGPRRLVDVARVILISVDQPLEPEELAFVMKHMGYRFQDQSLINAINYSAEVGRDGWRFRLAATSENLTKLRRTISVAPDRADFGVVLERTQGLAQRALEARVRRLRAVRRGLSRRDPIYSDGSLPPSL